MHKEQSLNLSYYILQPAPKQQKGLQFLWRDSVLREHIGNLIFVLHFSCVFMEHETNSNIIMFIFGGVIRPIASSQTRKFNA